MLTVSSVGYHLPSIDRPLVTAGIYWRLGRYLFSATVLEGHSSVIKSTRVTSSKLMGKPHPATHIYCSDHITSGPNGPKPNNSMQAHDEVVLLSNEGFLYT